MDNNNNQQNNPQMPVEEDDDENAAVGNPNVDDDDDEEDGSDEEPMDEEDENDDDGHNQEDNDEDTLEGGVAEGDESRTMASDADIVLYFLCTEQFKEHPDHPILRPGVKVRIGLGKNTRLSAVMQRYVEVCNELRSDGNNNTVTSLSRIGMSDLEFVHAAVLKEQDTAEQGALMKDDVVRVRQNRWEQVEREQEVNRVQRESDYAYLDQMRGLVDSRDFANVVIDCQGSSVVNNSNKRSSFQRQRQTTRVYCDSAIVSKRCPWLGRKIDASIAGLSVAAPSTERSKSVVSLPEPVMETTQLPDNDKPRAVAEPVRSSRVEGNQEVQGNTNSIRDDDDLDEHPIQVLDFAPHPSNQERSSQNAEALAAAQIETDDESQGDAVDESEEEEGMVFVVIPNHSPEAMRLLLEYIYTHRVASLGHEAFRLAARTKPAPREGKGNLPPHGINKRWANRGEPTLSFDLAAAAVVLGEEASMSRFSLMCEVAASHLVSPVNVIDALSLCKRMEDQCGNPLQRLRKAAMEIVLHSRAFGVYDSFYKLPSFKEAVEEKSTLLVPALFTGTADAVEEFLGKKRYHSFRERDWKTSLYTAFRRHDQDDKVKRAQERSRNRKASSVAPEDMNQQLIVDELDALGNDAASRKCMKRLRGHSVRSSLRRLEKRERRGSH